MLVVNSSLRRCFVVAAFHAALLVLGSAQLILADDGGPLTFEQHVRPILKAYCLDCHGGDKLEGGLDLRLKRFMVKGGDGGAAIQPGQPAASTMVSRMKSGEMPPGNKLNDEQKRDEIRKLGMLIGK